MSDKKGLLAGALQDEADPAGERQGRAYSAGKPWGAAGVPGTAFRRSSGDCYTSMGHPGGRRVPAKFQTRSVTGLEFNKFRTA